MPGVFYQPADKLNRLSVVQPKGKNRHQQTWIRQEADKLACLFDMLPFMGRVGFLHLVGVF
jgi:hypothetical protein